MRAVVLAIVIPVIAVAVIYGPALLIIWLLSILEQQVKQ